MLLLIALFHSFYGWLVFHCVSIQSRIYDIYLFYHIYLLYPFICQWTFSLLPCLVYYKSCVISIEVHVSFFMDISPGVGLLDHMETLFLVWWTSTLSSIVAAPIYIPTNSIGGVPFLPVAFVICRHFNDGHSDSAWWYLTVVLTCISLLLLDLSDDEHFFMCVLANCIFS